jgi:branched-chain amino acid transport system permease protein
MSTQTASRRLSRELIGALVVFALFAGLPVVADAMGDTFIVFFTIRIMVFAIAAVSLSLILGYGAMVSFGHAAYLGLGAYSVAILAEHGIWDVTVSLPVTLAVCGLFALVTGAISLKTRGVYFIMITLAFGQMAYYTATSLSAYGGDDGLTMWGRTEILGSTALGDRTVFYYVVLGCLLTCYLLARMIVASRFGRVLQGAKQSEMRLRAIGIDPYAYRLVAYVIAGMMAGLAGALLANAAEFVSPRLYVLAPLGRTHRHGGARRSRVAARRHRRGGELSGAGGGAVSFHRALAADLRPLPRAGRPVRTRRSDFAAAGRAQEWLNRSSRSTICARPMAH